MPPRIKHLGFTCWTAGIYQYAVTPHGIGGALRASGLTGSLIKGAMTPGFVREFPRNIRAAGELERIRPDRLAAAGRIARGTALRLLAVPRYDSSARLVPQAIRLGLAQSREAEYALVDGDFVALD